jgi:hypothetical protein
VVPGAVQRAHHVLGVPLWPVRIRPPELLLVNSVRGCGTLKRLQQEVCRLTVERFVRCPSRKPLLDLLQQPNVTVGIAGEAYEP